MATLAQLVDGVVTHKFEFDAGKLTIGRLPGNDVIIDDSSVSSHHAVIECVPNPSFPDTMEYVISDLDSTNGTEVNGESLAGSTQLHHNDEVKIAWNIFKFIEEDTVNLAQTMHILK